MDSTLDLIAPAVTAVVTGTISFALLRRKHSAETNNLIVEAAAEAVTAIRAVMAELSDELAAARAEAAALKTANEALRAQVDSLTSEVARLHSLIANDFR